MAEDGEPFGRLPAWPAGAMDVPDDGSPRAPARVWVYALAGVGAAAGLALGAVGTGDPATAACGAVGLGLVGLLLGFLVDRAVWQHATRAGR